jgi:hypothetical protein
MPGCLLLLVVAGVGHQQIDLVSQRVQQLLQVLLC